MKKQKYCQLCHFEIRYPVSGRKKELCRYCERLRAGLGKQLQGDLYISTRAMSREERDEELKASRTTMWI